METLKRLNQKFKLKKIGQVLLIVLLAGSLLIAPLMTLLAVL